MKVKAVHNGKAFTGYIGTEEIYNKVKDGRIDWKEDVKPKISHYTIPAVVFERLMALDIAMDKIAANKKQQEAEANGTEQDILS